MKILLDRANDSLNRDKFFEIANNYYNLKEWQSFKKVSAIVLNKSMIVADTSRMAKAYRYQAEYYKNLQINDTAYFYYLKSEKLYSKLNDKLNLGKIFLKKGIIQFYANDYLGADISTTQAYNLLKNSNDKETVYQVTSMIGIISNEMKDYNRAIEKHKEALTIVREHNLNNFLNQEATSLNNIGNVYQNLNKNKEAIFNFKLALENASISKDSPDLYAILLDNLAYAKFNLREFDSLPTLFYKSLKIRDSLNMASGRVLSKIHLSEFYAYKGDTARAQEFAEGAMHIAKMSKTPSDILASLQQLSTVNHRRSSIYSAEYIRINDSLQQAERTSQAKLGRIQLETDEIIQEKDKLEQQNRSLFFFFVGILMIGLLLFVIRIQRSKNRELLLKQAQQKANEDIYNLMITQQNKIEEGRIAEKKRIAQELHDGILGRLFGTRLNLDSLNKMIDNISIKKRDVYLNELKNIEQDIREISHDLNREKYVLINNFIAILNNLLEEQNASFASQVIVTIDDSIKWESLSNALKINLYRIIQEALQNINKYANSKVIKLDIKKIGENLTLSVADDGIGFLVNSKRKGIGLQNMLARTKDLAGLFEIRSEVGKGTVVKISLPLNMKKLPNV